MNQIWIKYMDLDTKVIRIKKYWYADDAKQFIEFLKKDPSIRIISVGGFEDEDEMRYAIGR